jgi:hypothetical protein
MQCQPLLFDYSVIGVFQTANKNTRNKMQADFRRDPPSHEACRINRIIYVSSATATDTVPLGKIKAIPFITHPQVLIPSSLLQREIKIRLFGCPSLSSVTISTELRRLLIVVIADFITLRWVIPVVFIQHEIIKCINQSEHNCISTNGT